MTTIDSSSEDLFDKLRNRFEKISMGDEQGLTTTNPRDARFFNFSYVQNEKNLGNITISIVDKQNLKVFYGQEITDNMSESELNEWYRFLRELRRFAKSHIMTFDVRDITKQQLNNKDLDFLVGKQNSKENMQESKVIWRRKGNRSLGVLGDTKIDVLHDDIGNDNPNNRLLRVQKIYLKNPNDERFLLPFNSVLAAKAMANHVSKGGTPYDETGVMICDAINEAKKLQKFCRYAKKHEPKDPSVLEAAQQIKSRIKDGLTRLTRPRAFDHGIDLLKELNAPEDNDHVELYDDVDDDMKPYFEAAGRAVAKMKNEKIRKLNEVSSLNELINSPDFKMNLRPDEASDQIIKNSKFSNTNMLLSKILRTIADRTDNDTIRQFAQSTCADINNEPADPSDDYVQRKTTASNLARKFLADFKKSDLHESSGDIVIRDKGVSFSISKNDIQAIVDLTIGEDYNFTSLEGANVRVNRLENQYKFSYRGQTIVVDGPKLDGYN
jgi:hypothetical protein